MKYLKRFALTGLICIGLTTPTHAEVVSTASQKTVTVTFRDGVSAQLITKISNAFSTPLKKTGDRTYVFQVPALRTQDQYAELFASLPSVASTVPMPVYKVADHINPQAVNVQPGTLPQSVKTSDYLPGEVMVKYKAGVSKDDIAFLNQHFNVQQLSRIGGIDVYRLRLPRGMSVEEAVQRYGASPLVEFAEPNYKMALPQPVNGADNTTANTSNLPLSSNGTAVVTQIPLDGGGQMLIHFRPGSSQAVINKFQDIYGTRWVQKTSFYSYRVQLPPRLNAATAARVFKLYPGVSDVQRLYS